MNKRIISYKILTPKLLLSMVIASIFMLPNALIANTINYGNLGIKLVPFKIKEQTSVYQIATQSNLTIEQLNNLNRNQIRGRNQLSVGETIFVPSDSRLVKGGASKLAKANLEPVTNNGITPAPVVNQIDEIGYNPKINQSVSNFGNLAKVESNGNQPQNGEENSELSSLDGLTVTELMNEPSTKSERPAVAVEPKQEKPIESLQRQLAVTESDSKKSAPIETARNKTSLETNQDELKSQSVTTTSLQTNANSLDLGIETQTPPSFKAVATSDPVTQSQTLPIINAPAATQQVSNNKPITQPNQLNASTTDESGSLQQIVQQTVSNNIETALERFGTAQASVSLDEKAKFKSLNFNVLGNIFETQDGLLFAQVGVNNQGEGVENRTVGNVGIGYRHDFETIRAGANLFVDQDFTKSNTRMSIGGELAADYMNITSNFYAPVSGWKQSDIIDKRTGQSLKERAAKGYDINANVYLPQHPQLGGGIMFEQYFGDSVGLFSEDERQRNPSAFGASIHYTPIPLLTAKAAHKIGNNGKNDTLLNVDVNLQLGRSLSEQVDPANVSELRTLKGSKYDIVSRNYSIVYEYESQSGQVVIAGPRTAKVNEVIQIQPTLSEGIIAKNYTWQVSSPNANQEYSGEVLNIPLTQAGQYNIQLAVMTENNEIKLSNRLEVLTDYEQNKNALLAFEKSNALASFELDKTPFISDIDPNYKLVLNLNLPAAVTASNSALPTIMWKTTSGSICANWCDLNNDSTGVIKSEIQKTDADSWSIHIIGSEAILGEPLLFKSTVLINGMEYPANTQDSGQFN